MERRGNTITPRKIGAASQDTRTGELKQSALREGTQNKTWNREDRHQQYLGKTMTHDPGTSTFTNVDIRQILDGLPKWLVFQRKSLVGDFCKRTLSDAAQLDKLLQQILDNWKFVSN